MQRQQDGLVPIGDALSGTGGAVKGLQPSPQALRPFTQVDQANALVTANEADPDLGFMARLLVLCSLPRTNPGDVTNLTINNFSYRVLSIEPVWIMFAEQALIKRYKPVWNSCLDGFGKHDQGTRRRETERSWWDTPPEGLGQPTKHRSGQLSRPASG